MSGGDTTIFKSKKGMSGKLLSSGMCNSLATFQAMMDSIFADMIEECIVIVYVDNIFLCKDTGRLGMIYKDGPPTITEKQLIVETNKM